MANADRLGIGTMGFGGDVTLLGCKIGALNRLPASFFVSVAYNCWAFRRLGVRLDPQTGAIRRWLFRDENPARMAEASGHPDNGPRVQVYHAAHRSGRSPAQRRRRRGAERSDVHGTGRAA